MYHRHRLGWEDLFHQSPAQLPGEPTPSHMVWIPIPIDQYCYNSLCLDIILNQQSRVFHQNQANDPKHLQTLHFHGNTYRQVLWWAVE